MSSAANVLESEKLPSERDNQGQAAEAGPDGPTTVIEPRPAWHLVDLGALWRYRELLFFLTWRDVKVRYKQTVLGATWAVLQPFATMVVFAYFLGQRMAAESSSVPYSLFVFAGLLPWLFIANGVTSAGQSIIGSYNLVTKVYFPRLIIPTSAVGVGLIDLFVSLLLLVVLMAIHTVAPGWSLLLLPLVAGLLLALTLGMGILLSALTVAYRDFRYVVPFGVQLWMFATPSIYVQADTVLSPRAQLFMPLNPAYGIILNFRQAMLGGPPDWYSLAVSGAISLLLLAIGCAYFHRIERDFADII